MNAVSYPLRLFAAALALLSFFGVLSACAVDDDVLVVYSGRSDRFVTPVIEAFTNETGIKVVLHSGKAEELLQRLRLEAERTEADLFLSNDAGTLRVGGQAGLFTQLPQAVLTTIGDNYQSPAGDWVGLSARARVLVVNTTAELPNLDSVFDLVQPELQGRIGITSATNSSFVAGATVYLKALGETSVSAWFAGLKSNAQGEAYAKHSAIVRDVAAGRKDVGLVNHYYIFRHLAEHPEASIRMLLPDQGDDQIGLAWNTTGVAISRHSENMEAAERFVAFVASARGQEIYARQNHEYPVRTGIAVAAGLPERDSIKVADVPMTVLGDERDAVIKLIQAAGLP